MEEQNSESVIPVEKEIQASLFIYDGEPEKITRMLGVQPSIAHRKGDVWQLGSNHKDSPLRHGTDVWVLDSPLPKSAEEDEHIEWLLSKIRPHTAAMREVGKKYYAMISFTCFYYEYRQGIRLEKETLKELADLNIVFDFDVYSPAMRYLEHGVQIKALEDRLKRLPIIKSLDKDNRSEAAEIAKALAVFEDNSHEITGSLSDLFWDALNESEQLEVLSKIKIKLSQIDKALSNSNYLKQP